MSTKKSRLLTDKDRRLLAATSKSTWAPPDPIDLIVPFSRKDEVEEETDLEKRRRKSREVLEGYQRLEARCKEAREELSKKCKNVSVEIDPEVNRDILVAARRIFKRDVREITFEMYKQLVHTMAEVGNDLVPDSAKGRRLV